MVPGQKPKKGSALLISSYEDDECSGVIGNLFHHVTEKLWR